MIKKIYFYLAVPHYQPSEKLQYLRIAIKSEVGIRPSSKVKRYVKNHPELFSEVQSTGGYIQVYRTKASNAPFEPIFEGENEIFIYPLNN